MDYFYDEQFRRYILQFIRIFADLKIELPVDENGVRVQKRVPITYGDMNRMVAQILRSNSQNTAMSAPAMAAYITGVELAPERRYAPQHVHPQSVAERQYSTQTGEYSSEMGNRYTIESYMPVPYNLTMSLDIWTTNTTEKLQILEQLLTIFNPTIQLQTNDNPLDFTTITEIELTSVQFNSRSVPSGTSLENDFATLVFKVPVFVNPPSKVKRIKIVEQIVASIYDLDVNKDDLKNLLDPLHHCFTELDQVIITPGNHLIAVTELSSSASRIELLTAGGASDPTLSWEALFSVYGRIDPETTNLRLKTLNDIEDTSGDILGSIEISSTESNIATFIVDQDSLPSTMISGPVLDIIDPQEVYPGSGLPAAAAGQRYLLIGGYTAGEEPAIPANGTGPWGSVVAYENDIIQYDGATWNVSFDSQNATGVAYVVNTADSQHYKFDGTQWLYTYLGNYNPGYWRIEI